MRNYETARKLFSFLEFVAWGMVGIGVIASLFGAESVSQYGRNGATLAAAMPGIAIAFFGVFLVAIVQNSRASVDTAEYTQQMLKVARDQLAISRASQNKNAPPAGFQPPEPKTADGALSGGYAADAAGASTETKVDPAIREAFVPIDAGRGFTQLNADGTELGYRNQVLQVRNGRFELGSESFESLEAAREHIDGLSDPDA